MVAKCATGCEECNRLRSCKESKGCEECNKRGEIAKSAYEKICEEHVKNVGRVPLKISKFRRDLQNLCESSEDIT